MPTSPARLTALLLLQLLLAGAAAAQRHNHTLGGEGGALGAHAHAGAAFVEAGGESKSPPCAACLVGSTKRFLPSPIAPVPQADSAPRPLTVEPGRIPSSPCARCAGGRSPPPA